MRKLFLQIHLWLLNRRKQKLERHRQELKRMVELLEATEKWRKANDIRKT